MRNNALFFPFISVPKKGWTINTLLYWDKLASIVPFDHIDNPKQLTPFMRGLINEGLIEQLHPGQYIYEIEKFDECFINLISHRLRKIRKIQNTKYPVRGLSPKALIHAEKLGVVQYFLVDQGLAEKSHGSWYSVERWAANLFMAYLASSLGSHSDVNAAPVTNQVSVANMFANFTQGIKSRDQLIRKDGARDLIIKALLPYPNQKVSMAELLKFKEMYGHLLPEFRNRVEAHCAQVSTLDDEEARVIITNNFVKDSLDEVSVIESAMKTFWKNISFSSLTPITGAALSVSAIQPDQTLAITGAAVTLTGAISQAISSIRTEKRLTQAPLAYVAHAHSKILA
ncbi:MAG: hypothetical protein GY928_06200 [Colwellia sp.]|nr:hypothetical protein [Colwellia sp.]